MFEKRCSLAEAAEVIDAELFLVGVKNSLTADGSEQIPAEAHYRVAANRDRSCGTCSYFGAGTANRCGMYDTLVAPEMVCDNWAEGLPGALPDQWQWSDLDAVKPPLVSAAPDMTALSTMICLKPRPDEAEALADPDGDPPETLHVTLAYLGDFEGDLQTLADALRLVAASHAPLEGVVAGYGTFQPPPDAPWPAILLPDVPGLVELRVAVTEALVASEIDYARNHGFAAHLTLEYVDGPPTLDGDQAGSPLHFDELLIVRSDDEVVALPLMGAKPLTAAGPIVLRVPLAEGEKLSDLVRHVSMEEALLAAASEPLTAALPARTTPANCKTVDYHNHLLALGYRRADQLEAKLAAVLKPILDKAGEDAARAFTAKATNYLTAASDPQQVADARGDVDAAQNALRQALQSGDEPLIEEAKARVKAAKAKLLTAVKGPQWSSPSPDELVDVDALTQTLRTRTDPIRQATIESSATPALEAAGLSWDASQPLIQQALIGSAKQITSIAETTRKNVAGIVQSSIEEGLSIPDAAKAITVGMKESSLTRATLIARTEIAGAVHAGSLAATQLASQATGQTFEKSWATSPGAQFPRHEDYDGLDGQTVGLDELFEVGDAELQFPGDPDGPPEEICNCIAAAR